MINLIKIEKKKKKEQPRDAKKVIIYFLLSFKNTKFWGRNCI